MRSARAAVQLASNAAAALALGALALQSAPLRAHPHFQFTYQLEPVIGSDGVSGLRVRWQVDAVASAQIRGAADLNRDGRLDADELAAFALGNDRLLRLQRYFLRVDTLPADAAQGDRLKVADAEPPEPLELEVVQPLAAADRGEEGIELSFEMRFAAVLPAGAFSVRLFDPTWNVALVPGAPVMTLPAVTLPASTTPASHQAGCHAETRTQTLLTVGWGEQQAPTVLVRCAPADPVRPQAQLLTRRRTHPEETNR